MWRVDDCEGRGGKVGGLEVGSSRIFQVQSRRRRQWTPLGKTDTRILNAMQAASPSKTLADSSALQTCSSSDVEGFDGP